MDKSVEIRKLCEEKQIRMIDFKMTDIDGRLCDFQQKRSDPDPRLRKISGGKAV